MSERPDPCLRVVAEALHAQWRTHGAAALAEVAYPDLPARWQQENLASAREAMAAVREHTVSGVADLDVVSQAVHTAWLDRNTDCALPRQRVPYARLDEAEKDKDRCVARVAAAALGVALT